MHGPLTRLEAGRRSVPVTFFATIQPTHSAGMNAPPVHLSTQLVVTATGEVLVVLVIEEEVRRRCWARLGEANY